MDIKPTTLVKLLLPLTPLILKTALLNALALSPNSKKQNARTEVTITIIRAIVSQSKPLSFTQRLSLRDPGIKGPSWISKVTIPSPLEPDALDFLLSAIKDLGDGTETFTTPSIAPVEAEWTGHRADVDKKEPRPDLPEADQYARLMKEATSPATILYFHGGAYLLMDPASHRKVTTQLAKLTGGRCLSVRYRLAPQSPFPAQLLDAFISYLYLLSPPPGSYHQAVAPSSVIFAGDSAGGNLAVSLSLLITTLNRLGHTKIPFHGQDVPIAPPAGLALNSPWLDLTHALPSIYNFAKYDYISPPDPKTHLPVPPPIPDNIWPTSPPRAEFFCNASILTHPLVSPLAAKPSHWENSPPMLMLTGYEALTDSILISARHVAHSKNTSVQLVGYEGMPHCFAMVFPTTLMGRDCLKRWADFCVDAVSGKLKDSKSKAQWNKAFSKPPQFREVSFDEISELSDEEVDRRMRAIKEKAVEREGEEVRKWEEKKEKGQGQDQGQDHVQSQAKSEYAGAAEVESKAKL